VAVKNQVQLITYPDSLGGDLHTLYLILRKHFSDIFKGGVHILPPFPSSGDRGFAPLTYLEINPSFGGWEDIRLIGNDFGVLLDLMVNHISMRSEYFQDFLVKGRKSEYADMFIPLDKMWPERDPTAEEIDKIFLRRHVPYSEFMIEGTGQVEKIWTTFGKQDPSEQIDMDINSPITRKLLTGFLENFRTNNVTMVRLDALPYVVKKAGTNCFFVEPEVYEFLEWFSDTSRRLGIELLPEVHDHYTTRDKLVERGYWVYDFVLPYFVLAALINREGEKLKTHLRTCPRKQFTMLDCHDGVPVKPDLDDLATSEEARRVVDVCLERGSNLSRVYSSKYKDTDGFDVHQIRGTYYSMLGCDDDAYLAARAIQFFTPGVPQVYYVGLLAGENDIDSVERDGDGRAINRRNYSIDEIETALEKNTVQRLLKLIRFRNEYPAFEGELEVGESPPEEILLTWEKDRSRCSLKMDLSTYTAVIEYIDESGGAVQYQV